MPLVLELKKGASIFVVEAGVEIIGLRKTGNGMSLAIRAPKSLTVLRDKVMTDTAAETYQAAVETANAGDVTTKEKTHDAE